MATIKRKTQNKTIRKKSLKQTGGKGGKTLRKKMIGGTDGGGIPRPKRMPKGFGPGGEPPRWRAAAAAQQVPVKAAQQVPVKNQAPQQAPVSQVSASAAVKQVIMRKGQPRIGASGRYRSS